MKARELILELLKYDIDLDLEVVNELNSPIELDWVSHNKRQNIININVLSEEE